MPTVFRLRGFRFFFFSLDRAEPIHIHVEKGDAYAKFWLRPVALARSRGFAQHEITEIRRIVETKRLLIERAWNDHFAK